METPELVRNKYVLYLVVTISPSSGNLTILVLDISLNILFQKDTNLIYDGQYMMLDYDTSPLVSSWCSSTSSPCSDDNILMLMSSNSVPHLLKFPLDLSANYYDLEFNANENYASSVVIDKSTNKVFTGNLNNDSSSYASFIYRINNENASVERGIKIEGIGSIDGKLGLILNGDNLVLTAAEGYIIIMDKNNLNFVKHFTFTSTLTDSKIRTARIYENFMYGGITYTNGSVFESIYFKVNYPFFSDLDEDEFSFQDSTPLTSSVITTNLPVLVSTLAVGIFFLIFQIVIILFTHTWHKSITC